MLPKKSKTRNEASSSRVTAFLSGESIIVDFGRNRTTCGYCKSSTRSSISHGLWTESLTVDDYQALLDRGWRRSGCFLYKPEMDKTCCPSYTIRLKASEFVPSKEQQRVCRRLERFLDGDIDVKLKEQTEDQDVSLSSKVSDSARQTLGTAKREETNEVEPIMKDLSDQIDSAVQRCILSGEFPSNIQIPQASVKKVPSAKKKKLAEGPEELLYTSNIAFPIAAAINNRVTAEKGERNKAEETRLSPEIVSEMLVSSMNNMGAFPGLSISVCKGHINFLSATSPDTDLRGNKISRGTKSIRRSKSSNNQTRERKLEIHLKRSSFDPEEYELYKRYQLQVHKDDPEHITVTSYKRFLVDTPLIQVQSSSSDDDKVPPSGFGSFHQQYRLDGNLIAVGVIDILPKCLSSKYLFWDPDCASLSLGNYSALQEINWVKQNQPHCYYYLGYYIHSCNKMRYKAAYRPSQLLCPVQYQWVPFEVAKPLLDKNPYAVLSSSTPHGSESLTEHQNMEQGNTSGQFLQVYTGEDHNIANVLISLFGSRLRYKDIPPIKNPEGQKQLESLLVNYRKVVGVELSEKMVYKLR